MESGVVTSLCMFCCQRQKNASLIHGRLGHQVNIVFKSHKGEIIGRTFNSDLLEYAQAAFSIYFRYKYRKRGEFSQILT